MIWILIFFPSRIQGSKGIGSDPGSGSAKLNFFLLLTLTLTHYVERARRRYEELQKGLKYSNLLPDGGAKTRYGPSIQILPLSCSFTL